MAVMNSAESIQHQSLLLQHLLRVEVRARQLDDCKYGPQTGSRGRKSHHASFGSNFLVLANLSS